LRPVLRLRFGFRTTSGLPGMSSRKPSVLSLRVSPGVDRSSESGVAVRDAMVGIGLRLWKSVLYFDSGELSISALRVVADHKDGGVRARVSLGECLEKVREAMLGVAGTEAKARDSDAGVGCGEGGESYEESDSS